MSWHDFTKPFSAINPWGLILGTKKKLFQLPVNGFIFIRLTLDLVSHVSLFEALCVLEKFGVRLECIPDVFVPLPWAMSFQTNELRDMNIFIQYGLLRERARWSFLALSGLPGVSRKKDFPESKAK